MSAMVINVTIQLSGDPSPQSYNGTDVSNALAFINGLTLANVVSAQVAMSCVTTGGEDRSMPRGVTGATCEAMLLDAEAWLTENEAYE